MTALSRRLLHALTWSLLISAPHAFADSHENGKRARLDDRLAAFSAAFQARDAQALDGLLAEHYSHTNNSSQALERADWLETMRRGAAARASGAASSTMDYSDVKVRVSRDTAVVTGLVTMKGQRNGEPFGMNIRYTQVWAWDGEDWYRVAFHDTYTPLEE